MTSEQTAAVPLDRRSASDTAPTRRHIAALLAPYRRSLLLAVAAVVLDGVLTALAPFATKAVFDKALFPASGGPNLGLLTWLALALITISFVSAALGIARGRLTDEVGNQAAADLRTRVFEHLHKLEPSFFTASDTGPDRARLAADVDTAQATLTTTAGRTASDVVAVAAMFTAMVILSWQLTVAVVVLMAAFVAAMLYAERRGRRAAERTEKATAFDEAPLISGILLAKVFNRTGIEKERYRQESRRQARLQMAASTTGRSYVALAGSVMTIVPAALYLVAGHLVGPGSTLSVGTLVAFTLLQARLPMPLMRLARKSFDAQPALAPFQRVFDYLALPASIRESPLAVTINPAGARGEIELRDVWFSYPPPRHLEGTAGEHRAAAASTPGFQWALSDCGMHVAPGQFAAVVGPRGSGKTTAAYLIRRFYDVDRGACLIDGIDVRDITLTSLAGLVGLVTEAPYLFYGTVRDNLTYGKPEATQDEVEAAASTAGIHAAIMSFKQGYDTIVGEGGHRLSGSETQRLAIARTLLTDPPILIVHEATKSLDVQTERLAKEAIDRAARGRTTIALAQRLSTLMKADVIFVLDRGRVVEEGSHEGLLARRGLYWRLYLDQFGGGAVEARLADGVKFTDGTVMASDRGWGVRTGVHC